VREGIRCSIRIEQDMSLAQLFWVRSVLQVFLETVLSDVRGLADGADGRLVDGGGAVFCHGYSL